MIVRSSTSNSEARFWLWTWLFALGATIVCGVSWEVFWRYKGFVPSLTNDPQLWITARKRVSEGDGAAVVLVGSSRMQLGINPEALTATTRWRRPVQLAIAMGSSMPILEDLSRDVSFRGLILCGLHPLIFFDSTRQLDLISRGYLKALSTSTTSDRIEQRLRMTVQQNLVSRLPALSPRQLWRSVLRREWPSPSHVVITSERFGYADFQRARNEPGRPEPRWMGRPYDKPGIRGLVGFVERAVQRIREHGGDVVFVRMPSSGSARVNERRLFPRKDYWDFFAAQSTASTIHFEDYPELKDFVLPDGDHLDQRQAVTFSAALGPIVQAELERMR